MKRTLAVIVDVSMDEKSCGACTMQRTTMLGWICDLFGDSIIVEDHRNMRVEACFEAERLMRARLAVAERRGYETAVKEGGPGDG